MSFRPGILILALSGIADMGFVTATDVRQKLGVRVIRSHAAATTSNHCAAGSHSPNFWLGRSDSSSDNREVFYLIAWHNRSHR